MWGVGVACGGGKIEERHLKHLKLAAILFGGCAARGASHDHKIKLDEVT